MNQFLVKISRTDQPVVKTLFFNRRKHAINAANSIGFVFWGVHAFKRSECCTRVAYESGDFKIEFIPEVVADPDDQSMDLFEPDERRKLCLGLQ